MTRDEMIVLAVGLLLAFGLGRYSSVLTSTTTVEDKTQTQNDTDNKSHTVKVVIVKSDGSSTTTETTDSDLKQSVSSKEDLKSKVVVQTEKRPLTNVSLIVANDFMKTNDLKPRYGASVTHEVLGSMTMGLFGINNGTLGVSIGYNF